MTQTVPMAMDVVQKQVIELSDKVDTLHALVEQLTEQVSGIASVQNASLNAFLSGGSSNSGPSLKGDIGPDQGLVNVSPMAMKRVSDPMMVHKDVLSDEPHMEGDKTNSSTNLSPEVQIQRLTAQLTAAYNRMAALEEQILACRFQ
ncbi:MAG: hypothetical protein AAF703_11135 [Cyanobacteria bacterium P01_D01_bin.105]